MVSGGRDHVSLVGWSSHKLKRVARSSLSAELQAMATAEDELHLARAAWTEIATGFSDPRRHVEMAKRTPGTAVIDAKALYDALTNQTQPLQLAEKRGALELLAYARNTKESECMTRWVHSGANIADAMTKSTASAVME